MAWWQWLVGILLFIVALGVLVGIHELGHLSAAKLFHVYCVDYSIGFGPKLLQSKKSKKHETTWTLRAIPLGGFVAMYGEGMELEENEYIPPSRSLEGVARYKRAIIISAGVFLNFVLGFVLILLHNGCFPHISVNLHSSRDISAINRYDVMLVMSKNDDVKSINNKDGLKMNYDPLNEVYVIDNNVSISGLTDRYYLVTDGQITTTKTDPAINYILYTANNNIDETIESKIKNGNYKSILKYFIAINENIDTYDTKKNEELNKRIEKIYEDKQNDTEFRNHAKEYYKNIGVNYTIDKKNGKYSVNKNTPEIPINLKFYPYNESSKTYSPELKDVGFALTKNSSNNAWNDIGIHMERTIVRYNASQTFRASWNEWCQSNSTIFVALGNIFTGNLSNLGGPVKIAQISSTVLSNFGFERYLYLWGQISCNLAIINLLPFPGLDGWSLLVICYEGITKKQVPAKAKAIISAIGLLLLFGLMIVILVKDVVGLIAV